MHDAEQGTLDQPLRLLSVSRGSSVSAVPVHRRPITIAVGLVIVAVSLLGCTGVIAPEQAPTTSATQPSPSASPTEPAAPQLIPDGTAEENLPLFSQVTAQVWQSDQKALGRAYIDALTAAGFDKAKMQVTNDRSTVGNPAESLQFSVAWGERQCLVGQVGPSTGEQPVTAVMAQLAEGRCLVGSTRPIDW